MKLPWCVFWLGLLVGGAAVAQTPDCVVNFNFSAVGQRSSITGCGHNTQGVYEWRVIYRSTGFTGPFSLRLESSLDGVTWATFAGTLNSGINPNTATTDASTDMSGFNPYVSVALNSAGGTGAVSGALYGCRQPGCSSAGISVTATIPTPVPVDGPTASGSPPTTPPVLVAGFDGTNLRTVKTDVNGDQVAVGAAAAGAALAGAPVLQGASDGVNVQNVYTCTNRQIVSISAATDVTIITATAAKTIRICHLDFSSDTTANMTIRQGTGTTCGTTQVDLTGAYQNILGIAEDYTAAAPLVTTVASRDVCLHFSTNVTAGGVVIYAVF